MTDTMEIFHDISLGLCVAIAGAEAPIASVFACEAIVIQAEVLAELAGLTGDADKGDGNDNKGDDDNGDSGGETGAGEDGGAS